MVNATYAQKISEEEKQGLLHRKKLSLVLDLDHTLIHCTVDSSARQLIDNRTVEDVYCFQLENNPQTYFVKLRYGSEEAQCPNILAVLEFGIF